MENIALFAFVSLLASFITTSNNTMHFERRYSFENESNKTQATKKNSLANPELGFVKPIDSDDSLYSNYGKFTFQTDQNVKYVLCDNPNVFDSFYGKDGLIFCNLKNLKDASSIVLSFLGDNNELIDTASLFFAMDDSGNLYSSSLSLDTAKRKAGKDLGYRFYFGENDEVQSDGSAFQDVGAKGRIYGTLKWTDEQGNIYPLIGVKVAVTIEGSWWRGEAFTYKDGSFSIEYSGIWHIGNGKPTIHIFSENQNVKVCNEAGGTYEKYESFNDNAIRNYSYTFNPQKDGDLGKAMMIFQGAKYFSDYAKSLSGSEAISSCNFKYPIPKRTEKDTSHYYNGNIYLINESYNGYPEVYSAWDVIGHEYGHFVQDKHGITANPGGYHSINENNIDRQFSNGYSLDKAKDRGYKLAWAEGWATYWSTVAQTHFPNVFKSIRTVGDYKYTANNGVEYGIDLYGGMGDADEIAVQRILFKLFSEGKDEFDKFSISEYKLWEIVKENKVVTFFQFIDKLYSEGYSKEDLGILLGKFNIFENQLTLTYDPQTNLPTFTISTFMGSKNLRFNEVVFLFGPDGKIGSSTVKTEGNSATYTITAMQLRILYYSGDTFEVSCNLKQTSYFNGGNYYTKRFVFNRSDLFSKENSTWLREVIKNEY